MIGDGATDLEAAPPAVSYNMCVKGKISKFYLADHTFLVVLLVTYDHVN